MTWIECLCVAIASLCAIVVAYMDGRKCGLDEGYLKGYLNGWYGGYLDGYPAGRCSIAVEEETTKGVDDA